MDHARYQYWLEEVIDSGEAFGMSDLVLNGVLRIVTNPRIISPPSTPEDAREFVTKIRESPNCYPVNPGPKHWNIFMRLCRDNNARGNLVPDAYFAALAIESGCEWITTDRHFGRFAGLRYRHPFD
ncbi:MAG TPA: type II toxin-antitoxin system VapC family toxin [Longimicrobiaceae bacterium]|nr:type II toxin-antitoxin system VapC family toxin [Longimicrobiaceae bacterium]